MARTQAHREIAVGTPLGKDVLLLKGMTGTEELGRLFRYELELLCEDGELDFSTLLGQNVTVRAEIGAKATRYFNGYISEFKQCGTLGRLALYQATVVPWLWFLTRSSDCRIFQNMTIPDIVEQVFGDNGFTDFERHLSDDYPEWEYCTQYRETAFDFVSRLLEQEGIYYYFKHEDGKHTLVLADGMTSHEPYEGYEQIPFKEPSETVIDAEHISTWTIEQAVRSGTYVLDDFDFTVPDKPLRTTAQIERQHAAADLEMFDYPGEYNVFDDGEHYARVRIEELHTGFEIVRGEANAGGIGPGYLFELTDYPREDQCRQYLVTSVRYHMESDAFDSSGESTGRGPLYKCDFAGLPTDGCFRPARSTPKPKIRGPQTAIVTGGSDEEIHTDKYGRVKVQFHWDRYGTLDENSSCWIRVAQLWAGKKWGAMYIPRVGHEVIVEFLEGDPDRPMVTGRVYNGTAMPPHDLPANKTMSTLKSSTSTGGDGFNEIRFEDKESEQQVFIHAERNMDIRVKKDRFEWIGNNRHLVVKNDKVEHVENKRSETVDADHVEKIGKDRHLVVKGKEAKAVTGSHSFTVTGDVIEAFKANHNEKVTKDYYLKANNIVIEAMTNITINVGGSFIAIEEGGIKIGTNGDIVLDAKGGIEVKALKDVKLDALGNATMKGTSGAKVEGVGPTEVSSLAILTVKGSLVKIN